MANPTMFSWVDPTTNTDGSPITASEITGYTLGIRSSTVGQAGTYTINVAVSGAAATNEALSAIGQVLQPGNYSAAVRTAGPVPSAWTNEVTFVISPPQPNPPTNFTIA